MDLASKYTLAARHVDLIAAHTDEDANVRRELLRMLSNHISRKMYEIELDCEEQVKVIAQQIQAANAPDAAARTTAVAVAHPL